MDAPDPTLTGHASGGSSFSFGSYKARADLTLNVSSGRSYILRAESNAKWRGGDYYCDFWIADAVTNERVTNTVRVGINYTRILVLPV
jgi:hypothetical protein